MASMSQPEVRCTMSSSEGTGSKPDRSERGNVELHADDNGSRETGWKRKDSVVDDEALVSYTDAMQAGTEDSEAPAVRTTVDEQRALVAESSRSREEMGEGVGIRPAFAYRSNAVKDPWWPSHFLTEDVIRDLGERIPMISWRDRVCAGVSVVEGHCPAFWGEATDEKRLH